LPTGYRLCAHRSPYSRQPRRRGSCLTSAHGPSYGTEEGRTVAEPMVDVLVEPEFTVSTRPNLWGRIRRLPLPLLIGSFLVGSFIFIAILSFFWTPHDPAKLVVADRLSPPFSPGYLFGTDKFGRDVVS